MNKAISHHVLEPVVDEEFAFEDVRAVYHRMRSAEHLGKLAINVQS